MNNYLCKPEEAYEDFAKTNMDYLVLGNYVIEK
jgi:predicted NodU family carbamoyl transferase